MRTTQSTSQQIKETFMRMLTLCTSLMFLLASILISSISSAADTQENSWKAPPEFSKRINPVKTDHLSIEKGKTLFIKYCSTCHGQEGLGDGPVALRLATETPDLTAIAGKRTDGELAWKIATGRNPMPRWQDKLSVEQIWFIVNFIQNLQPATD